MQEEIKNPFRIETEYCKDCMAYGGEGNSGLTFHIQHHKMKFIELFSHKKGNSYATYYIQ